MSDPVRALVVDDEPSVRFTLGETLHRAGYRVEAAGNGEAALDLLREASFDLVILDLNLGSRVDGLRVLEGIRWRWPDTAVVILTAHGSLETAMAAIREGVDAYLLKPAEPAGLLGAAREALARRRTRTASAPPASRVLRHGPLTLDLDRHRLERAGCPIELAPTEFSLLACLMENAHRTVPVRELARALSGYEPEYDHEARQMVKWHTHRLRAKLEPDPKRPTLILNVRGVGYTLSAPPAAAGDGA